MAVNEPVVVVESMLVKVLVAANEARGRAFELPDYAGQAAADAVYAADAAHLAAYAADAARLAAYAADYAGQAAADIRADVLALAERAVLEET
jgi:hypothetical protein